MKRALVGAAIAVIGVGVWLVVRPGPEERSARSDVAAISQAVAEYVAENSRLPSVSVTTRTASNGDVVLGEDFLVESRQVPRADASTARLFFLAGDADRWCFQLRYDLSGMFDSFSPAPWVSAVGMGSDVGGVGDGPCGDGYVLSMSPVTVIDGPDPGSVINAATAPIGTCIANPFDGVSAGGDVMATGMLEVVACDRPHFGEIYHSAVADDADYAGYEETAQRSCATNLSTYVGTPRTISTLTGEPLTVDEPRWTAGTRQFSCHLYLGSEDFPLVGSAQDSRR